MVSIRFQCQYINNTECIIFAVSRLYKYTRSGEVAAHEPDAAGAIPGRRQANLAQTRDITIHESHAASAVVSPSRRPMRRKRRQHR
jgi:hypothetical protein